MLKKFLSLALAALLLLSFASCEKDDPIETVAPDTTEAPADHTHAEGDGEIEAEMAPDFTVYTADGAPVKLSDMKGKPVVVNFWATWCNPCLSELGHFEDMYKKYGDSINFMMVDMTDGSRETAQKVKAFVDSNGYTFPVYLDTKQYAAYTYSVSSIPMTLFINENGEIVYNYVGAMNSKTLENFITVFFGK